MKVFQSISMATYLVMGSDSLIGDNCIVLGVYEDTILFFVCFIFLDVAIIATSNNS